MMIRAIKSNCTGFSAVRKILSLYRRLYMKSFNTTQVSDLGSLGPLVLKRKRTSLFGSTLKVNTPEEPQDYLIQPKLTTPEETQEV